ncbi:peroxin [Dinochytrium kinnereticum]|nr:peroxin [Dinochytrium kinnereticum]
MGKRKPFIDRSQALTYQVVHRSQRDPAIADENASKRVLKPVPTSLNMLKKGKGLEVPDVDYDYDEVSDYDEEDEDDLDFGGEEGEIGFDDDEEWTDDDDEEDEEENEESGEEVKGQKTKGKLHAVPAAQDPMDSGTDAINYGIFFKDQASYDYLQHLKPIGTDPSAVFVNASTAGKKAPKAGIRFLDNDASDAMSEAPKRKVTFDLPSGVLGSRSEDEIGMMNREAHVSVLDIEPSMREVIYALEDEEYVEDDIDDFFEALDADSVPEKYASAAEPHLSEEHGNEEGEEWYKEYQRYKEDGMDSDEDYDDEQDDAERLTMMSMTSSALFRNKNLTILDQRFDELMKKEYDDDEDEEFEDVDSNEPVGAITQKRLDKIFDSFLDSTEVVGRKKLLLNRVIPMAQMDSVRKELKGGEKDVEKVLEAENDIKDGQELYDQLEAEYQELMKSDDEKEKWDVETVLTTYSNIYNRPALIKEIRKSAPRIRLRKGMPYVEEPQKVDTTAENETEEKVTSDEEEGGEEPKNAGEARKKGETKEEKRARKAAVKAGKKERRAEKKVVKAVFAKEFDRQKKTAAQQAADKAIPLNRRRFAIVGGVAGGCYVLYKYAEFKWKELEAAREMERTAKANVKLRFEQNQKDCTFTILRLLPTLGLQLNPALDVESITAWLQQAKNASAVGMDSPEALKAKKMEKWQELKVLSQFIYLDSVVSASGSKNGMEWNEEKLDPATGESRKGLSFETERQYLTFSWFLLNVGWSECVARVRKAVEEVIESLPLDFPTTYATLVDLIEEVRKRVELASPRRSELYSFHTLLLPPDDKEVEVLLEGTAELDENRLRDDRKLNVDDQLKQLLDETRDFLESPDFPTVLKAGFDQSFDVLYQSIRPTFFEEKAAESKIVQLADDHPVILPTESETGKQIKLAAALPLISRQIRMIIDSNPNTYVDALASLPELKAFSAVVYTGWEDF